MKQLSGMDSMFLYLENDRAPLEVGSLHIYDPSTAAGGAIRFKEILAHFQGRLDRCEVFRRKLMLLPFSLDYPYWIEDHEFDLEYHVRHISLPRPGGWEQLMAQVSRLQARPLDRTRPLWMVHLIEGLDNVPGIEPGSFAMFMKMHHSTIDGATGNELQAALHDLTPIVADASRYEPSSGPGEPSDPPVWNAMARTPFNTAKKSVQLAVGLARAAPRLIRAGLASRGRKKSGGGVPRASFNNGRVSPNRVVDGRFFSLGEIKRIRSAVPGTTVNDIALCVVAGALRRYLDARGELPDQTLIAGCPVNIGTAEDAEQGRGNQLSVMMTPLRTEIDDPVERLHAIHEGTLEAKAAHEALGPSTLTEIPMNLPAPLARNLFPLLGEVAVQVKSLQFNTMITNVAGIQKPLFLAGARMTHVMGVGPVIDQSGLFHAVFSYNGMVSFAFTACRDMVTDAPFYATCIEASYQELKSVSGADDPAGSGKTARHKKTGKRTGKTTGKRTGHKKKPRKKPAAGRVAAGRRKTKPAGKKTRRRASKTG